MLTAGELASQIPDIADQDWLNRRIRLWTDAGVIEPAPGIRTKRTRRPMQLRRYTPDQVWYVAMALELMDRGLNPLLMPRTAEIVRDGMKTNRVFAAQWEAAKRGDATIYLIARGKMLSDDNMEVEVTIRGDDDQRRVSRLYDATTAAPSPDGLVINLTQAFSRVRATA